MECEKHKGRDMDLVYSEPRVCPTCSNPIPPEVVGYYCPIDDVHYDLHSKVVTNIVVAEQLPPELVSGTAQK